MIFGKKTTRPDARGLVQLDALLHGRKRTPSVAALAKFIEAHLGLRTQLMDWTTSTDRKPRGCRYITRPGKGRKGGRLVVYREGRPLARSLFEHTTSVATARNERW